MRALLCVLVLSLSGLISASSLFGVDVSHYQGTIDWSKVAASNVTFAMAKATEGLSYVDPMFSTNYKAMKQNGLFRSAYHFAHPNEDANQQVRLRLTA